MSGADTETLAHPDISKETRMFLFVLVALFVSFVMWAAYATLDVISEAVGEVIPSSQIKSIQHLEGGIVRKILVRDGDDVVVGQPLVELEGTASGADVKELRIRIASLQANIARLEAERTGADAIVFPNALLSGYDELRHSTQQQFNARRTHLKSEIDELKEASQQRQEDIKEITSRLKSTREALKYQQEKVKISEELLKDDLTNRMLHLDLLKDANKLTSTIQQDRSALARARAALKQADFKGESRTKKFLEEVEEDLSDHRRRYNEFTQRIRKLDDNLKRTVLRSPVNGVVMALYVYTVGGVVAPGGTVAEVVPREDRLVVEAKLAVQDVGYIHPGQAVRVTLASGDAARFGELDGEVVTVSPDAVDQREGAPYYRVRIVTEFDRFSKGALVYKLVPGVQVTCAILTGERTVLEYILSPLLRGFTTAMRER